MSDASLEIPLTQSPSWSSPHGEARRETAQSDTVSLIDAYLQQQRELTAVERFSQAHARHESPVQERYYRDLIPLTKPGPGQQYAFEVDLDACSGCKACVTACHSLNGLDTDEMWRSVGLLVSPKIELPILQHVTSACHHCVEPACMDGCPVMAYEKDETTGIVRHLDDQCIGCQYCILKCPHDVPKYNKSRGIVRKCDMCSDRLAVGEAPACVQACPSNAIRINLVNKQQVIDESRGGEFLPGAHDPDYTLPTTRYKRAQPLPPGTRPADDGQVAPEHAHLSLVVMLVLTQLSVGTFAVGQALAWVSTEQTLTILRPVQALVALGLGLLALAASVCHLGRPLYAFRAVIGLRTSWLSREIVIFGLFAALATVYAGCTWFKPAFIDMHQLNVLGSVVAVIGLMGVFCSVMIYHDTRRVFWHARYTATKFLLTTVLLGLSTTLLTAIAAAGWSKSLHVTEAVRGWGQTACLLMAMVMTVKVVIALATFIHLRDATHTPMKRTARLLLGPLFRPALARIALAVAGGVLLPLIALAGFSAKGGTAGDLAVWIGASFLMTLASELLERYLFFAAVVAPKMPGGLGAN